MKRHEIAELFLKLLGLAGVAKAVVCLPNLVYAWRVQALPVEDNIMRIMAPGGFFPYQLGRILVYLIGGVALLSMAGRIATWLFKDDTLTSSHFLDLRVDSHKCLQFCFRLLGVYVLFRAAPSLAVALANGSRWITGASYSRPAFDPEWAKVIGAALQLALGFYLLRGGNWCVRFALGRQQVEN